MIKILMNNMLMIMMIKMIKIMMFLCRSTAAHHHQAPWLTSPCKNLVSIFMIIINLIIFLLIMIIMISMLIIQVSLVVCLGVTLECPLPLSTIQVGKPANLISLLFVGNNAVHL